MVLIRLIFLIALVSSYGMGQALAEETDQFTLPPGELQDIGPIASRRAYDTLEKVIAQTNSEIQMFKARAPHSRHAAHQLAMRRSDTYLANLFYKKTGPGFPSWMRFYLLSELKEPYQYRETKTWNNVYWLVFSYSPLFAIGLTPTINMFGYYFGTDKLGHIFMQGHTYYSIYMFLLAHGKTPEQAHAAMILYGQIIEQTYLGSMINGIYSNADIAANYTGWKFYMNFAHPVQIGQRTQPPILVLNGDRWEFSKHVNKDNLLKPYISDNLNEAWNPCRYFFTLGRIRSNVNKRCNAWITRKGLTHQMVVAKLEETRLWHGEDYGHWLPQSKAVTLDTCFGGQ